MSRATEPEDRHRTTQMRIVHVLLGTASADSMNGVNKVVHYLATEQQRAGHDVEVWSLTGKRQSYPSAPTSYRRRTFTTTPLRFVLSGDLREALRTLHLDALVQLHSVFIPEFRSIADTLYRRGIVYGLTPHGGYSPWVLAKDRVQKAVYVTLVEGRILRRAHLLHAVGESELDDLRRLAPRTDVVLVPNGQVSLERREPVDHRDVRPVFCFCGRLALKHKGLDLLLDGFSRYLSAGGVGTLWLVGDGPDRRVLESMIGRLGLAASVRLHGAKYGEERVGLLAAADVFVHTSRWEGLPTAVLEAAALGVPVLISHATNLAPTVERHGAGFVLADNTADEIAKMMKRAETSVRDGSARALGRGATEMIEDEFSWSRVADSLVARFRSEGFGSG
ncbi:MAG: glycosyltransferase [Chloroflexi bacterium]|nr:glycosyltransferase [Chloroflexota bacterium]